jgi:beta-lactamase superfamily II metal-dependent hydrolase
MEPPRQFVRANMSPRRAAHFERLARPPSNRPWRKCMKRCLIGWILLFALVIAVSGLHAQQSLQPLPPWTPGTLEIHQISTGIGNAAFSILPDGTSLLLDAGDLLQNPANIRRPDSSRGAGEWVARYAQRMLRHDSTPAIDYAVVTHLHGDHIGAPREDSPVGQGGYKLAGLSEVAEHLPVRRVLDRGWPNYSYPSAVPGIEEYRKFLNWQRQNRGLQVERFQAGRNDQLKLLRDAAKYPTFEIRNIVVNGEAWTGTGTSTRQLFPSLAGLAAEDYPPENSCSLGIRISYGRFRYFAGGDLSGEPPPGGPAWTDVESAIAPVVGPVDVAVLDHHGMGDATNTTFLKSLRPRVIVIPTQSPTQPDFDTTQRIVSERIYPGPRDIFATSVLPATRTVLNRVAALFKSMEGHVVVRVAPGGDSFQIFVLDDSMESYAVKSTFGPYQSQ